MRLLVAGTKVDDAKALIANSGLRILPVDNLEDAARLVCLNLARVIAQFKLYSMSCTVSCCSSSI